MIFNRKTLVLILTVWTLFTVQMTFAETYDIDTSHSSVDFKIKHLAISNVSGTFSSFSGTFDFVPGQPELWSVEATIEMKSVDTGDEDRDEHLQNEDFFDVEKFPLMTFQSTKVIMEGDDEGQMIGNLTLHGQTHPVTLDLEFNGALTDPWGSQRAGFTATGKINRKEWGLSYGKVLEGGGLLIGNDVKITLEIEGVKKK